MSDAAFDDDDLLAEPAPAKPAAKPTPKDPSTGRFVSPDEPRHSAYMLARAREYGVHDADAMSPAELDRLLTHLDTQGRALRQQAEPEPKPEPEEPIDWGVGEKGEKLSEADYSPVIARAVKAAHKLTRLEKSNAELQAKLDRQEQERNARQALRKIHAVLATRPDLFGEKPGDAAPGSAEAKRYGMVIAHINGLLQSKSATTPAADAEEALALFPGAKAKKQPPVNDKQQRRPSLADYSDGELVPPTARRGKEHLSRREQLIELKAAERRENGLYVAPHSADDDDDLPD